MLLDSVRPSYEFVMTDISICIPTFARSHLIEKTLAHLLEPIQNSPKRFEIVITDNSLDDKTEVVIGKFRDVLNINYHRHHQNIGAYKNLLFAYGQATGKFCLYLADDDQLILEKVEEICDFLDLPRQKNVNVVFAPWVCLSPSGYSVQFYTQTEKIISIIEGDYLNLLLFLLKTNALPEIFIFRRQFIKPLQIESQIGQYFLLQAASFIEQSEVVFWSEPFYLQTIHDSKKVADVHAGHLEAMEFWDHYRGGLEVILAHAGLAAEEQARIDFLQAIDIFVVQRILVAINMRLKLDFGSKLDVYLLALRACALGAESALIFPLPSFKKLAAIEFIFERIQNLDQFHGVSCDLDLNLEEKAFLNQKVMEAGLTFVSKNGLDVLCIGDEKTLSIEGSMHSFYDIFNQLP